MFSKNMANVFRDRTTRISIGIIIIMLLMVGSALGSGFRLPVTINAAGFERIEKPVEVSVNFTQLLNSLVQAGTIDENSIHVSETDSTRKIIIDSSVPSQFDKDTGYNPTNKASGTVVFIMEGTTLSSTNRYYYIYFDIIGGSSLPVITTSQVALTDGIIDQGQTSYKIDITDSSFFFQKEAGGFSSWNDKSGNDWIGWSTANGPSGKYRGIPNAVNPEEVFHPGFYCCTSSIVSQGPIKIRVRTANGTKWEALWDFYPRYATMTMTKMDHNYWFLYEGTPGGVLEPTKDFMVRSNGVKTLLNQSWAQDIPSNEWVYFSDPSVGTVGRSLFVTHQEDDTLLDQYWSYNYMTVFGFGRKEANLTKLLSTVPQHFTIGLIDGTDFAQNSKLIYSADKNLTVINGIAELDNESVGPLAIELSLPTYNPNTILGVSQTFSINLNKKADIKWYIDGSVVQTDLNIQTSSYANSVAGVGIHTVNATAKNGTEIVSKEWKWTVSTNVIPDFRVTYNSAHDRQPVWSPDGQWIAFIAQRVGDWDIYKINKDTGESSVVRLTTFSGFDLEPSWHPNANNKIVYSRGSAKGFEDIFVMNTDGTGTQQLTNTTDFDEYPDWSPDGTKIVYASVGGIVNGTKQIWVMNSDGTGKKRLNTIYGIQPAWSPDGTKIAFKSYSGGPANIWVMNSDGTNPKKLTSETVDTHDPDWSPDGKQIAYASKKTGNWSIYVMNADGTNQVRLTSNIGIDDNYPAWSPDGRYIAYASNRAGKDDIWIMDMGSGNSLSIMSSSPTTDPITTVGNSQMFSIDLNKNANIVWYIDGSTVKTDTGVATSSYTSSTTSIGTHVVNATAKNGTETKSRIWTWTVQDNVNSVTVVSPNGGENLTNGTTKIINWNYIGDPGPYVKIELLKGGGLNSIIIGSTSIGSGGIGSYSWSIPNNQTFGNDYKIRITSTNNTGITDDSNNYFTIGSAIVVVPTVNLGITIKNGSGSVEVFRNDSGVWNSLGSTTNTNIYVVEKGAKVKILAAPEPGQIFEKYVTDLGVDRKDNPIIANQNWTGSLDAYFSGVQPQMVNFGVNIKNGSGSVEVFRNDSGTWTLLGSTVTNVTYTVVKDAQLKVIATPGTGQIFEKYVANTGIILTINPLVVNQNSNGSLDTYFKITTVPTVNLGITIKNGSGSVEVFRNDSGVWNSLGITTNTNIYVVEKGARVKILATPEPGQIFEKYVTDLGADKKDNPIIANQNWTGSLDTYFKI